MRPLVRFAALAALALAAACSSYNPLRWVGITSAPAHPPTPLAPIQATLTPRAVWTASVGKSAGFNLRPAIEAGHAFPPPAPPPLTVPPAGHGRVVLLLRPTKPLSGRLDGAHGGLFPRAT